MVMFETINRHHLVLPVFFLQAAMKAGLSDSEIKEALKLSTTKEIKDKLKRVTQEALDHGVSCPSVLLVSSDKTTETRHYDVMNTISPVASSQAFGLPLLVCHVNGKPEMFFGSDRFELMAHCIGEKLDCAKITKTLNPNPQKL